jgi:hypothetical protein
VSSVLLLVGLTVPVALVLSFVHLATVCDAVADRWHRLRRRRQPAASPFPVQQIAADLHRLERHIAQVERSDAPAQAARLRAAVLAYDDELLIACRTLRIPAPERAPLAALDRLETEAALARHGLLW